MFDLRALFPQKCDGKMGALHGHMLAIIPEPNSAKVVQIEADAFMADYSTWEATHSERLVPCCKKNDFLVVVILLVVVFVLFC
jgi:hypothetical protein